MPLKRKASSFDSKKNLKDKLNDINELILLTIRKHSRTLNPTELSRMKEIKKKYSNELRWFDKDNPNSVDSLLKIATKIEKQLRRYKLATASLKAAAIGEESQPIQNEGTPLPTELQNQSVSSSPLGEANADKLQEATPTATEEKLKAIQELILLYTLKDKPDGLKSVDLTKMNTIKEKYNKELIGVDFNEENPLIITKLIKIVQKLEQELTPQSASSSPRAPEDESKSAFIEDSDPTIREKLKDFNQLITLYDPFISNKEVLDPVFFNLILKYAPEVLGKDSQGENRFTKENFCRIAAELERQLKQQTQPLETTGGQTITNKEEEAPASPVDQKNQEASLVEILPSSTSQAAKETKESHSPVPATKTSVNPTELQSPSEQIPARLAHTSSTSEEQKLSQAHEEKRSPEAVREEDINKLNDIEYLLSVLHSAENKGWGLRDSTQKRMKEIREKYQVSNLNVEDLQLMIKGLREKLLPKFTTSPPSHIGADSKGMGAKLSRDDEIQKLIEINELIELIKIDVYVNEKELARMQSIITKNQLAQYDLVYLMKLASELDNKLHPKESIQEQAEREEKVPSKPQVSTSIKPTTHTTTQTTTQKTPQPLIKARITGEDLDPIIQAYDKEYKIKDTENYQQGYKKPELSPDKTKTIFAFPVEKEVINFFIEQAKANPGLIFTVVDERTNLVIAYSNGDGTLYNGKEEPYKKLDIKFESSDKTLENFIMPENDNQRSLSMI